MALNQARKFGRTKTLKATTSVVLLLLVFALFSETRGDFANGILFFIEQFFNIHNIAILCILFGLTYIFGGLAGNEIIIHKKNLFWTSIKYAILIILAVVAYAATVGIRLDTGIPSGDSYFAIYFLKPLLRVSSISIVPLLLIWLWATNQMKLEAQQKAE